MGKAIAGSAWRPKETKIWNWRISGKSSDNKVVTLGKYDTENEARACYDVIAKEGFYHNVKVEQVKPVT